MDKPNTGTDYSRKWLVMISVAMGSFLSTIDGSIVNVALPILQRELRADFALIQWVVLAYMLVLVTLILSIGRLADMIGKKNIFMSGYVVFTLGSLLCGVSQTAGMLIVFRGFQAIGAAMMMALSLAIITEAFPPEERGKAIGIMGSLVSIGLISGPTIGGLILNSFTWHWIFFVNLPIGVIGTLMVFRFVPDIRPAGGQRFDIPGALTLFVALLSLLLAITFGEDAGYTSAPILALFTVAVVFFTAFLSIERRTDQPMMDLSMFSNGLFSINLITGFLVFISSSGVTLLMPFFLQNVLGYSPTTAGLMLATVPACVGIIAPFAGSLSDRFGSRPLTVVGLGILLAGFVGVTTLDQHTSMWNYILHFIPIGIGTGFFQSPNNSAIMGAAPRHRLGVASGLLSITRTMGQTTGIAVLGALWASLVGSLGGDIDQATLANAGIQVAALRQTLYVVVALISVAFLLSIWALVQDRKRRALERAAKQIADQTLE